MRHEPLRTLLRLRRLTLDEAKLSLAACLERESVASDRVRAIETSIRHETDRASEPDGSDAAVETFATWLRHARDQLRAAEAELDAAETQSHEARVVLGASRQAVEVLETTIDRHDAEVAAKALRREQHVLDEVGARLVRQ